LEDACGRSRKDVWRKGDEGGQLIATAEARFGMGNIEAIVQLEGCWESKVMLQLQDKLSSIILHLLMQF